MFANRLQPTRARTCRALLCLLWLGMLLHGQAEVQRRLLGPAHWHAMPATPTQADAPAVPPGAGPGGWAALRGGQPSQMATGPLVAGLAPGDHQAGHHHHHQQSQRHHHGPNDASVVALQPLHDIDANPPDGTSGSLLQPLALAGGLGWWPPPGTAPHWPAAAPSCWRDASLRLPERPPCA